jgi:hypothetical protein
VQGRHEHGLADVRARRLVHALQCPRKALRADLEVGLLVEYVLDQRGHRRARAAAPLDAHHVDARASQIAVETVEALEQLRRLRVARQAPDRRVALRDEVARERSVAVEPRARRACSLRVELEPHLGSRRDLRAQMSRDSPHQGGQRGVELARVHRAVTSRRAFALLLGERALACAGACAERRNAPEAADPRALLGESRAPTLYAGLRRARARPRSTRDQARAL